jgi:hypothetical protein
MAEQKQYECGHCKNLPEDDPRAIAHREMKESAKATGHAPMRRHITIPGTGQFIVYRTGKWETLGNA